jgi:thioredoxin reductase
MMIEYDVIIAGSGPAGLSNALYLGRARRSVLLCNSGRQRNASSNELRGFLTREGSMPHNIIELSLEELAHYPNVTIANEWVEQISGSKDNFTISTRAKRTFTAKRIVLATGMRDATTPISGLAARWGKSVFVCPFCDGWEVRDQQLLVYGRGRDVVELAQELYGWSKHLHLCAEYDDLIDSDRRWLAAAECSFSIGTLERIDGPEAHVHRAILADGTILACDAIFLSAPLRQRCGLAQQLGCRFTDDDEIAINSYGETSVRGCYAAGDAVTHFHQVVIAAASGAKTAISISDDLLSSETQKLLNSLRAVSKG